MPQAQTKGLELTGTTAPEVPDELIGDSDRVEQVLGNLVANAVRFTDRGRIEVRLEREPGDAQAPVLRFTVRDSGGGIPADRIEQIFEAFTQLDSSLSREHQGAGLGLAISARLVAMMGGRIWADSKPGKGTDVIFTVSLAGAAGGR
jgi:signal transduction histidine kinase